MTQEEAASHWQKRAKAELKGAVALFEKQDPELYSEVLFHCHLSIELALKASYIMEKNTSAPLIHNLGELASLLHRKWTDAEQDDFDQLSRFSILARYGDAQWITEEATKENAEQWLQRSNHILSLLVP